jgi:NNP family nitrate/nitrite transporter-like MFS transporter
MSRSRDGCRSFISTRTAYRYTVFIVMAISLCVLSVPSGRFIADGSGGVPITLTYRLGLWPFAIMMFVLGCAMGVGKASVYKYIPDYFPEDVGAAGGVVGALGALGGFILPPAFGILGRWVGIPQLAFVALLALTMWSLGWLHLTVVRSRTARPVPPSASPFRIPAR